MLPNTMRPWARSYLPLLTAIAGVGWATTATAATRSFPSATDTACSASLQTCIDSAAAGDRIEIVDAVRIDEALILGKSVTLTGADGITPLIGSADPALTRSITIAPSADAQTIVLQGLHLDGANVEANLGGAAATTTITLRRNTINAADGYPVSLHTKGVAGGSFTLLANTITSPAVVAPDVSRSSGGVNVDLRGTGQVVAKIFSNLIYRVGGCADENGSAAGIAISTEGANANVFITNNTIVETARYGLFVGSSTSTQATNVFNNLIGYVPVGVHYPDTTAGLTISTGYNDFEQIDNGPEAELGGYPFTDESNRSLGLVFVDRSNGDFHLAPGQNKGLHLGLDLPPGGLPIVDADDFARRSGAAVDMGAFEVDATAASDLAIAADAPSPATVSSGANATFTFHVTTLGPSLATGSNLTFPLPTGATFVSATSTRGRCTGTSTVTCALGTLSAEDTITVTIVATMNGSGDLAATATVATTTADPDATNDTAEVTVEVGAGADSGADAGADAGPTNGFDAGTDSGTSTPDPNGSSSGSSGARGHSDAGSAPTSGGDDGGDDSGCSISPGGRGSSAAASALFGLLAAAGARRFRRRRAWRSA